MYTPTQKLLTELLTKETRLEEQLSQLGRQHTPASFRSTCDPALASYKAALQARLHEIKSIRKSLLLYGTPNYSPTIPEA